MKIKTHISNTSIQKIGIMSGKATIHFVFILPIFDGFYTIGDAAIAIDRCVITTHYFKW